MNEELEILEPKIDEEVEHAINKLVYPTKALIVYNDDYNTFNHVIMCFIKYCNHNMMQAEQCAFIIHNKGKCDVKHGSYDDLEPICHALLENGLTAKIED